MIKKILAQNNVQFRNSLLFYFGNFALNFFRYLFHLVLLRFLTPPEYGEFLSYLSLIYILAIPTGTIGSLVTKSVADYKGKGDTRSINSFFYYLLRKTAPIGFFVGVFLILLKFPLATLFKAHPLAFTVLGVSTFISLFQTIVSSYLIGLQKFMTQTVLGFVSTAMTIAFSIVFIKMGYGATGAVLGQIISGLAITVLTIYIIRDSIYPHISSKIKSSFSLKSFAIYSFINSLGTMSLMSLDVLVVRVVFDSNTSGLYSSLSILGRMILFGLTPIISLVLPIVSVRYAKSISTVSVFVKFAASLLILGLFGVSVFAMWPETIISILSGNQYLAVSPLLPLVAITMVIFALSMFMLSYMMATGRGRSNYLLLFTAIVQPIVLYFYAYNLRNVVFLNFKLHLLLLLSLLIYLLYPRIYRLKFKHEAKAR